MAGILTSLWAPLRYCGSNPARSLTYPTYSDQMGAHKILYSVAHRTLSPEVKWPICVACYSPHTDQRLEMGRAVILQFHIPTLTVRGQCCTSVRERLIRVETFSQNNYTGCNRRNGPDFARLFLMLNYTDITQNTYIQNWTVTEIMAIEMCGLLGCRRTLRRPWRHTCPMRPPAKTW